MAETMTLKPCAHCGSEAKVVRPISGKLPYVTCTKCFASSCPYQDANDAIASWNRRAFPSVTDFARRVIRESVFDGASLDGADVQEMAVEFGLLEPTSYDPERHGPSDCAEPGDEWFVFAAALQSQPDASRRALSEGGE